MYPFPPLLWVNFWSILHERAIHSDRTILDMELEVFEQNISL